MPYLIAVEGFGNKTKPNHIYQEKNRNGKEVEFDKISPLHSAGCLSFILQESNYTTTNNKTGQNVWVNWNKKERST